MQHSQTESCDSRCLGVSALIQQYPKNSISTEFHSFAKKLGTIGYLCSWIRGQVTSGGAHSHTYIFKMLSIRHTHTHMQAVTFLSARCLRSTFTTLNNRWGEINIWSELYQIKIPDGLKKGSALLLNALTLMKPSVARRLRLMEYWFVLNVNLEVNKTK